jgi:phosphatidylserine decarboxylase
LIRWATALLSRGFGLVARAPVPAPLRRPVLGTAARVLGMDLDEAAEPVASFGTLDALFTRELRPGARSWPDPPDRPGSPVDGVVGMTGRVAEGTLLQAKGREYTVAEASWAARFESGTYVTLYLSPRHYHRIHAPVGGTLDRARHLPGRLLPVNRPAVEAVDRLFPRNERLISLIETPAGSRTGAVAVVAVGAFNVGRITAAFDPGLATNRRGARPETRAYAPAVMLDRGDELMTFHLGSTVVLLFEGALDLAPTLERGADIRLGAPLTA